MEQKNLDIYGHAPIPWSRALKQLDAGDGGTYWLATTRPNGEPHLTAVAALWVDGKVYFVSGARTRKSRDLAKNPRCVISVSLKDLDVVIEGTARQVPDDATLKRLASLYGAQGWAVTVKDGAFTHEYSAPSAGPPPWDLYVITPVTAFGVATAGPQGATRWRFS
ncbi:MAG: pyridoxamine 5'-phosphate oxidase family protein [Chloroflexota bacterium]|nr:pyridoxamine 5'-phosphate oxidase family protein [Chloroflexota bacterium]